MKIIIILIGSVSFFVVDYEEPKQDIPTFSITERYAVETFNDDLILREDTYISRLQQNIQYTSHTPLLSKHKTPNTVDEFYVGFT